MIRRRSNEQFNRELAGLTEENADTKIFNLGSPSSILLSAGVEDKPMKLYGNKVIKKMKKHGFALRSYKTCQRLLPILLRCSIILGV